jgi:alpha-tubulin suppressor-like RCC1 family protein
MNVFSLRFDAWAVRAMRRYAFALALVSASALALPAHAQRYVAVSVGSTHACGLRETGQVFCWGSNSSGQLGDGTQTASTLPVRVVSLDPATAVSAGLSHTCAIVQGGKVKCWGSGLAGQLGNGGAISSNTPVEVTSISTAIAIGTGFNHSCALLSSNAVQCWGSDFDGQLGNDVAITGSNTPVAVALGTNNATALAVGSSHACVRRSTGGVACWGNNFSGQIGDGTAGAGNDRPTPVNLAGVTSAAMVAAGASHTCLALTSGAVQCWGDGSSLQIGLDSTDSNVPRNVPGASNVAQLALGSYHSCARLTDGTAQCWGLSSDGRLGRSGGSSATPQAVVGLANLTHISGGIDNTCAVRGDGQLLCWGRGVGGVLGSGGLLTSATATTVAGLALVTSLAVSNGFSYPAFACARLNDGSVSCWGDGSSGQLGNGTTRSSGTPVAVLGLTTAQEIAVGRSFACARLTGGTAQCWGDNFAGKLGRGASTGSGSVPAPVSGLTNASQVVAGNDHACARLASGSVVCWGSNSSGQLGNGTTTDSNLPVPVTGIANATDIAAGEKFTCARLATGSVACWGENANGQLGDGNSPTDSLVPVFASGITTAASVNSLAAGDNHICAKLADLTLRCWGRGSSGQLGNGGLSNSDVPVVVTGFSGGVGRPALGSFHSCMTKSPGNIVQCWGDNRFGSLGNGNAPTDSLVPVTVFGVADTSGALAAGGDTTCAIVLPSFGVRCWGSNANSVLGNGQPIPPSTSVPTPIAGDAVCSLDIDGNGTVDAMTDLLLLARARMGLSDTAVTANAIGSNAQRNTWDSIRSYLQFNCNMTGLAN